MPAIVENQMTSNAQPPLSQPVLLASAPPKPTPTEKIVAALRTLEGLRGLSEQEYLWLATHSAERVSSESSLVFRENELRTF